MKTTGFFSGGLSFLEVAKLSRMWDVVQPDGTKCSCTGFLGSTSRTLGPNYLLFGRIYPRAQVFANLLNPSLKSRSAFLHRPIWGFESIGRAQGSGLRIGSTTFCSFTAPVVELSDAWRGGMKTGYYHTAGKGNCRFLNSAPVSFNSIWV